jgi:transposase-like protein
MAAVALANGLNANVLRRWVNEHETSPGTALAQTAPVACAATQPVPGFIPIKLGSAPAGAQEIKLELRTGAVLINITWPVSAASECAAWVAAVIR